MSYSEHRSIETKFKPGELLANFLAFSRHHYCSGIIKNELSAQICRGNIPLKFQNKTTSQNMCKLREIQNSKIAAQHHTSARVSRCGHVRKCCSLSVTQHLSQCEYCYKKKQFMLLCNNHWLQQSFKNFVHNLHNKCIKFSEHNVIPKHNNNIDVFLCNVTQCFCNLLSFAYDMI